MRQRYPSDAITSLPAIVVALTAGLWPCALPAADYRVIAEQNLFDPQRKPWPEPAAPAAAVKPIAGDDIQVQGIVMHAGVRRAIVKLGGRLRALAPGGANGRAEMILSEGQALGGYTLESVQAQQLVFASGGERYTVALKRTAQRDNAGAPPAPLPVIQSATLPVAETSPAALPAPVAAHQPSASPPRASAAAAADAAQAAGQFPGAPRAGAAAPVSPAPAPATAAAPATGMTLLQAIQAAEAARRAGQVPTTPPVNPFQPRPQP